MDDYSIYSLEELVEMCRETGAAHAWAELVNRTHRLIWSTIRSSLQRWGMADSAVPDLVQETYLKISVNGAAGLRNFESRHAHAILGYLRATAVSVAHDHRKREVTIKRGGGARAMDVDELDPPARATSLGGEASIEKSIILKQIQQILVTLPLEPHAQRDRQIFWLYYRQGMTANSIAAIPAVGLSVKGVESVIFRLTRMVRNHLAGPEVRLSKGMDSGSSS